ncbi:hypothetical protein I552_4487 [Mycobacterium xenopi 3993]|nr:hypothetical protein I552_4487 [Mycobacterium xenopi 3993]
MADSRSGNVRSANGRVQVDVDIDAAVGEQVDQIFGGNIAGGAWRERAASQAADRGVQPDTPAVTAAYALARPAPRVLWKCAPKAVVPINGRNAAISETTRPAWWCRWCRRSIAGRHRPRRQRRRCRARGAAGWARRTGSPRRWR